MAATSWNLISLIKHNNDENRSICRQFQSVYHRT
jgi:hypothetical protein